MTKQHARPIGGIARRNAILFGSSLQPAQPQWRFRSLPSLRLYESSMRSMVQMTCKPAPTRSCSAVHLEP